MGNTQAPWRQILSTTGELQVHHVFNTIQGEGPFTGERAVFLRLAGCNLQCPLCDTDYTSQATTMTPREVARAVEQLAPPPYLVVITGGEPFRQNLWPAIGALLDKGYRVQIETNGTLWVDPPHDLATQLYHHSVIDNPLTHKVTIVCSPKGGKINPGLALHVGWLKYVLHADSVAEDGLPLRVLDHPAEPLAARPPPWFPPDHIYLNPCDTGDPTDNKRHVAAVVDSCLRHGYRLGLQLHKIVELE